MQAIRGVFLVFLLGLSAVSMAAKPVQLAVISDGPSARPNHIDKMLVDELLALTRGEFDLQITRYQGDWTRQGIERAFQDAYANRGIDMVLVTGIVANQIGVARENFVKPTFLPLVLDTDLLDAPGDGRVSGVKNLNYLAGRVAFRQSLASLRRVTPAKRVALLGDQLILESVPRATAHARQMARDAGIELIFIPHDGSDHDLVAALPADVDAVMLAAFLRMPDTAFQAMIAGINDRKLPSFSLLGSDQLVYGILMTDRPAADLQRLSRRNALNMQAVMLGGKAAEQPVIFENNYELTLNMATAREIGLSPRFDVLSEAVLLNELPAAEGQVYTLAAVAHNAVSRNLGLNAEAYGVDAGRENITGARAGLLPQLSLGASHIRRKQSAAVLSGQLAEESTDSSVSLSQLVYADSAWANLEIQRRLQQDAEAAFDQSRLEVIQGATTAYLNVLRAETQLHVRKDNLNLTKTNLQLARDRVRVGASSAADVYRWETRIAGDRSSLLQAKATLNQARENLNRVLNRPLTEPFQTATVHKGDPFAMSPDEFDQLVNNPRSYGLYTDFILDIGIERSPELAQLGALMKAKKREITNRKRAFWVPDIGVNGSYGDNLNQAGVGAGPQENQSNWNVSVNASLPLFDGGARRADLSRARLEYQQLELLYDSTRQQIEQLIRANIHAAVASYANIDLSAMSAVAGRKNLELVTDAYAKGVVSVIDLLDAQNASLQADEAAANAVFDFLIDIVNMQRSVGLFEFMLSEGEKSTLAEQLRQYINSHQTTREH